MGFFKRDTVARNLLAGGMASFMALFCFAASGPGDGKLDLLLGLVLTIFAGYNFIDTIRRGGTVWRVAGITATSDKKYPSSGAWYAP